MTTPRLTLLALLLAVPLPAHAEDHLVTLADVQARMEARAGERETALALLGDDELEDLQRRAAVLRTDPAATGGQNYATGFVLGAVGAILFWLWVASQLAGT